MAYAELHCHSYYSFHDGASSLEELIVRSRELGYTALAVTDHDNLCGAMRFSHLTQSMGLPGIIGAEVTLEGGFHLTLLAENQEGYRNLSRLITIGHETGERHLPRIPEARLADHAAGLIVLSGCPQGRLSLLAAEGRLDEARMLIRRYLEWFGSGNYFIELQHNLVYGDDERNRRLVRLAGETGVPVVAAGNAHYHVRERHRLQDCLVAVKACKSLEASHLERRPNSEFYLRAVPEIEALFRGCPEAVANTVGIAARCTFNLAAQVGYALPDYPAPEGYTPESYLEQLCLEAAVRRYGSVTPAVRLRLDEEFRLVRKHNLAGFLLLYHDVIKLGREVMIDQGLTTPEVPLEENPPGRGRGSSVSLLIGYLIGLSHIDPLQYKLSLERFLPEDALGCVPDIDLDFPRRIREELILRTHRKWGWRYAALTGTIATYQIKGAVRGLGKALSLPPEEVDQLAKYVEWGSAKKLEKRMQQEPRFRARVTAPVWRDLITLAAELDGFPKYLGQHPGGMIISSVPLTDIVPVQRGAMAGRYVCQWDKDSIDDAGCVKIDFLALGALSQMQDAVELVRQRTGRFIDMSRIDFDDPAVYDMLGRGDTIGIFQVESAAQMQTITRLKPRNLLDMAHEVAAVRPGVGANGGVQEYLARRLGRRPVAFDHPLEKRALERTLGVVLFQDQVNQLAIDVAGLSPSLADQLRRAFSRRHNEAMLEHFHGLFMAGAAGRGVPEDAAEIIWRKFNGQYMFPESHAFAFGVTAYQASWLKLYYPLEFFTAIFNQQPMGFYNLETLKEDAKRHGITVLGPDINRSLSECTVENSALRLGLRQVTGLGEAAATAIVGSRNKAGDYKSIGDFLERSGVLEDVALSLTGAGAFDGLEANRRQVKWEIGLRYRPVNSQLFLPLPVAQDMAALAAPGVWERMEEEYCTLGLYPAGHIMAGMRPRLSPGISSSRDIAAMRDGTELTTAGMVIRRQRPHRKVVFITLEDEFGHIPLMIFPGIYERNEHRFKSPFIVVRGRLSRRDGTHNLVVEQVKTFTALAKAPASKDWG
ncbi:MAG: DNA polymerase III subunit alpha [Dehalogenimonas sp.]|uniref:DNA polymerase III subunit alpha n=1 Tax=Candidatus Dehalogenimonas loeffleri TaxID=3127115 RepID=A0ABZ2J227_9CHLR|nr:DNA polymerase III subunit alpha [Dehalogenimonas sp.]